MSGKFSCTKGQLGIMDNKQLSVPSTQTTVCMKSENRDPNH